jgi:hypothetical protein
MFIALFENICGIGKTVDLAMEDLHDNYTNSTGDNIDNDNDIQMYDAKQVKVTKTWIVEPM